MPKAADSGSIVVPLPAQADRRRRGAVILLLTLGGILASRAYNYLLFHSLAELYSILIAATYAVISWHGLRNAENRSIAALGLSYIFVAFLDLFHTLSYAGMGVFSGYDYPANQLWICARLIEAGSLLAFSFIKELKGRGLATFLAAYGLLTASMLSSVFVFRIFPACYVAGLGQTPFKIAMELVIEALLVAAGIALYLKRQAYPKAIRRDLQLSILLTALSELSFILYSSNYDWLNLSGHLLKIASFYLVYRAIIVTCLERPQELLYTRLSVAAAELKEADHAKETLIAILGHDLRNPLSGIASASEGLIESRRWMKDEEIDEMLSEIAAASQASLGLVEGVLSWARCKSGSMRPRLARIDLAQVMRRESQLLSASAHRKDILVELDIAEGSFAQADPDLLDTIARNLLQNAIKFTNLGGRITVRTESKGDERSLEVEDNGVGMDEGELARLFRPDAKLRGIGTAGERGTGFGLVLSAEFARSMGGRLEAVSRKGEGSTFRLLLPAG